MFSPEEYYRKVGKTPPPDIDKYLRLDFPPNLDLPQTDYPITVVPKHWACYSCSYREEWYISKYGVSPVEEKGYASRRSTNVHLFNFPLLCIWGSLNRVIRWMSERNLEKIDIDNLLESVKMYVHMVTTPQRDYPHKIVKGYSVVDLEYLYLSSIDRYKHHLTFDSINRELRVTDSPLEIYQVEVDDLVIYQRSCTKDSQYYYPLIPSKLYSVDRFKIKSWGFADSST